MDGKVRSIRGQAQWFKLLQQAELQLHLAGSAGYYHVRSSHPPTENRLTEHLCWYVRRGSFHGEIAREAVQLSAGCMLWIMPGVPFRFEYAPSSRVLLYRFRMQLMLDGQTWRLKQTHLLRNQQPECGAWCERILHQILHPFPEPADAAARRGLILCLLSQLLQPEPSRSTQQRGLSDEEQLQVSLWLNDHLGLPGEPGALADALGYSHDYFTRLFRKTYGEPPRTWILRQRLRYAATQLQQSREPISRVAAQCGFEDLFLFSRLFRKYLGRSPQSFRASGRK
jgi:AraC-like DNA-binding protein/mannose-6-phosphate isomerase-like protein (cupin superfamily)